jgi:polyisoprenoid-binding protein YceI
MLGWQNVLEAAMRWAALAAVILALCPPALAAPVPYDLQAEQSTVTYETDFGSQVISGHIPISSADLVLDLERLANCTVSVVLDARGADASFPFAADALKGKTVLDAGAFPQITFVSSAVQAAGDGAKVTGALTIRGVTRKVTLDAAIYRQKGTQEGDRSRLTVRLTAKVKRSDFGAIGFAQQVGDEVRIIITARIARHD